MTHKPDAVRTASHPPDRHGARILDEKRHDPCGAVFRAGRWRDRALSIDFSDDAYEIRVVWSR
jgi:hypothetical protein